MFGEEQVGRELQPVSIDQIHHLFPGEHNWASSGDYLKANGSTGLQILKQPSGLYTIRHVFDNKQVEVPTPEETLKKYGTTGLQGFPKKNFAIALLWQFHGAPCERTSRSRGGEGYTRR